MSGCSAMPKRISHGDALSVGMIRSLREQTASSR